MARTLIVIITLVLIAGCSPRNYEVPKGTITGTVTGMSTGSASNDSGAWSMEALLTSDAPFVPGEIIVGFGTADNAAGFSTLSAGGVQLQAIQALSTEGTFVYSTGSLDPRVAAAEIAARPDVRYAHPNYILQTAAFPSVPYQYWNFSQIDLEQAWQVFTSTTGPEAALQDVVVAVVDTGLLHDETGDRLSHPAFDAVTLPGYDFIRDPIVARDGDGRDADPYDDGDHPDRNERSYHGTHVAGIIGAVSPAGPGAYYGVAPTVRILPVRVLGYGGGSIVDIFEGAKWAAGLEVPDVPTLGDNERADIINMSLTGAVPCSPYAQGILDEIAAAPQQPIVVVAAGNDGKSVDGYTPASCGNVITVGAATAAKQRAPYSNSGPAVDVLAPGGYNNAEGQGVPSAGVVIEEGVMLPAWVLQYGTSMAAPHVSGLLALMRAVEPGLTLDDALFHLERGASPAGGNCGNDTCGFGLLNAENTLKSLDEVSTMSFALSHRRLEFHPLTTTIEFTITNRDVQPTSLTVVGIPQWLVMLDENDQPVTNQHAIALASEEERTFTLLADLGGLQGPGDYHQQLVFTDVHSPAFTRKVDVFAVSLDSVSEIDNPLTVYTWVADERSLDGWRRTGRYDGIETFHGTETFHVQTEAADNLVIAWIPSKFNNTSTPRSGDWVGAAEGLVSVTPNAVTDGVHIEIEPRFGGTNTDDPLRALLELWQSATEHEE